MNLADGVVEFWLDMRVGGIIVTWVWLPWTKFLIKVIKLTYRYGIAIMKGDERP
jgi:hypothetical protein